MERPTTELAKEMYNQYPIFRMEDVMKLFSCSRATAYRMINQLPQRMWKYKFIDKDALYEKFGLKGAIK